MKIQYKVHDESTACCVKEEPKIVELKLQMSGGMACLCCKRPESSSWETIAMLDENGVLALPYNTTTLRKNSPLQFTADGRLKTRDC